MLCNLYLKKQGFLSTSIDQSKIFGLAEISGIIFCINKTFIPWHNEYCFLIFFQRNLDKFGISNEFGVSKGTVANCGILFQNSPFKERINLEKSNERSSKNYVREFWKMIPSDTFCYKIFQLNINILINDCLPARYHIAQYRNYVTD